VNCPAFADRATVQKEDSAIEISVDSNGQAYIGKDPVDMSGLGSRLQSASSSQGNSGKVLVRGDDAASYGRVAHVLASVSQALPNREVILVTQPPAADKAAPHHSEELEK